MAAQNGHSTDSGGLVTESDGPGNDAYRQMTAAHQRIRARGRG